MTLNPDLECINTLMNNQGRAKGSDELWFYSNTIAYKVTLPTNVYWIQTYNRFTRQWELLNAMLPGYREIASYLTPCGPFLPLDQIDAIWKHIFDPLPPDHHLDPLLKSIREAIPGGIRHGETELWYYTEQKQAFKVTNCFQKYCVETIRLTAQNTWERLPKIESGTTLDVVNLISGHAPFLEKSQLDPIWDKHHDD